jgi:hypothetical protein
MDRFEKLRNTSEENAPTEEKVEIPHDDASSINADKEVVTVPTQGKKNNSLIEIILLVMVFVQIGIFAYLFFTDRLILGVENPFSKQEQDIGVNIIDYDDPVTVDIVNPVEEGDFNVSLTFPAGYSPAIRLCFIDMRDVSVSYCFLQKASNDTKSYSNELVDGKGKLPVGEYYVEFAELAGDGIFAIEPYALNECTKAVNGDSPDDGGKCEKFYVYMEDNSVSNSYVNSKAIGGNPIVIKIEKGKTVDMGNISALPYFTFPE